MARFSDSSRPVDQCGVSGFDPQLLVQLRTELGFSRPQLARLIGMSTSAVQTWEAGKVTPQIPSLVKLARVFGVGIDVLVRVHPDRRCLADLRVAGGLTQVQLARALLVATPTLCAIEGGRGTFAEALRARYCQVLGVQRGEVDQAWDQTRSVAIHR